MNTATLTDEVTETAEAPAREFSHHDRCDRCGFQAYFVALRKRETPSEHDSLKDEQTQEILFCKHHGEKSAPGLASTGWTVLDFTHMLDKPLVSANVD
jgi:hypothetical protein